MTYLLLTRKTEKCMQFDMVPVKTENGIIEVVNE